MQGRFQIPAATEIKCQQEKPLAGDRARARAHVIQSGK